MKQQERKSATSSKSPKVQNGVSIPKMLQKFPNILELWLKRPDNPPYFISPTFSGRWNTDGFTGRVKDRGRGRSIWKTGDDLDDVLTKIDAELGMEWPDYKFDDAADQRRYAEQKDTSLFVQQMR